MTAAYSTIHFMTGWWLGILADSRDSKAAFMTRIWSSIAWTAASAFPLLWDSPTAEFSRTAPAQVRGTRKQVHGRSDHRSQRALLIGHVHHALDATIPKKLGQSSNSIIIDATNIARYGNQSSRGVKSSNKDRHNIFISRISNKTIVSNKQRYLS